MKPLLKSLKKMVVILLAAAITACSGTQATSTPTAKPIRIEYVQWWGDYTLIVAEELGLFEKYGAKVEPVYYDVFSDALPDLASGKIDAGLFAIGDAINVNRHTDVTVVAVYDNGGENVILARPEITKIGDLKGQNIGVNIGTPYELFVQQMLTAGGLTIQDINLINTNPEDVPARLKSDLAAGFTWEPYKSQALEEGNQILFSSKQIGGIFPDVIVFRSEFIHTQPENVRAFLKAWFEAVDYRLTYQKEANAIISKRMNMSLSDIAGDAQIMTLADNADIFLDSPAKFRSIYETTRLNADFLIQIGTLNTSPNLDVFIDPSYLK